MSKSQFDALYEEVTQDDAGALGIDTGSDEGSFDSADSYGGEDEGSEDTVTVTLDKATAKALITALQAVVGEDEEGGEDEFGGEDEGDEFGEDEGSTEEDEGSTFPESVVSEAPGYEELGVDAKAATFQSKGKIKVDGTAAQTASPKQEGGQTKGTEQYVKFTHKVKKDMKDVQSNLTPSGAGKSAFNRD